MFHRSAGRLRLECIKSCRLAIFPFNTEVHRLASKSLMIIRSVKLSFILLFFLVFTMHLVTLRSLTLLFAFLALSRREFYSCVVFLAKVFHLEWITLICIQLLVLLYLVKRFKRLTFE